MRSTSQTSVNIRAVFPGSESHFGPAVPATCSSTARGTQGLTAHGIAGKAPSAKALLQTSSFPCLTSEEVSFTLPIPLLHRRQQSLLGMICGMCRWVRASGWYGHPKSPSVREHRALRRGLEVDSYLKTMLPWLSGV